MNRPWLWAAAVATVTAAAVLVIFAWPDRGPVGRAVDPDDTALVALGRTVYARECAVCHGAERQGQPEWRRRGPDGLLPAPPLDGSAHDWHHSDDLLFLMVRDGPAAYGPPGYRSAMPAFGDRLEDREIAAVLSYVRSLWPARARAIQEEITRRERAGR